MVAGRTLPTPENFEGVTLLNGALQLSWTSTAAHDAAFQVRVHDVTVGTTRVFQVRRCALQLDVRHLQPGHTYDLHVRAVSGSSHSEYADGVTVRFEPRTAQEYRESADQFESEYKNGFALEFHRYAFELGDVDSAFDIARLLMKDFLEEDAQEWLLLAASHGNCQAMEALGDRAMRANWYEEDDREAEHRVPHDLEQGRHWYGQAVQHGSVRARSDLGSLELEAGNLDEAWRWLTSLDDFGQAEGWDLIKLGDCARRLGRREEARSYFARAWNSFCGRFLAAEGLGDLARDEYDLDKAIAWYERAVAENDTPMFASRVRAKLQAIHGPQAPAIDIDHTNSSPPAVTPDKESAPPRSAQSTPAIDRRTPLLELPPSGADKP